MPRGQGSHTGCPVSLANNPGGHGTGYGSRGSAPAPSGQKLPRGQSSAGLTGTWSVPVGQWSPAGHRLSLPITSAEIPVESQKCPKRQGVHASAPGAEYSPTRQATGSMEPAVHLNPPGQTPHSAPASPAPVRLKSCTAVIFAKVPAGHCVGAVEPSGQ